MFNKITISLARQMKKKCKYRLKEKKSHITGLGYI